MKRRARHKLPPLAPPEVPSADGKPQPWDGLTAGSVAEREQLALRGALPSLQPAPPKARPTMAELLEKRGIRFTSASTKPEHTDISSREEVRDPIARLTVYAINLSIMVFIFPVGLALLIFNLLGGENLRTTAHAMALTGMAMALSMTETGAQIFTSL